MATNFIYWKTLTHSRIVVEFVHSHFTSCTYSMASKSGPSSMSTRSSFCTSNKGVLNHSPFTGSRNNNILQAITDLQKTQEKKFSQNI